MKRIGILVVFFLFLGASTAVAQGVEYVDTAVPAHGYSLSLPEGFALEGSIDETTRWTYRWGADAGEETVLTIYVNRTAIPEVSSRTVFHIHMKSDEDEINSPNPTYTDLRVLTLDDGLAYRYKEVDKKSPGELHRWYLKAFGNHSIYTMGLAGAYGAFTEWGPVFEKVIASFRLIPLEK
jgi:hypothetical protein